jgi:thioredoxin reductase (NADPH)
MEESLYLSKIVKSVTVIHRRDTLRASKIMQQRAFETSNISFLWDSVVTTVDDVNKGQVTGVRVKNLKTGAESSRLCSAVFVAIGHTPNTGIFKGQIELDSKGYVRTNNGTRTNIPGVFACGDVQDHVYRQAVTAAGSGCMAALDCERYLESQE